MPHSPLIEWASPTTQTPIVPPFPSPNGPKKRRSGEEVCTLYWISVVIWYHSDTSLLIMIKYMLWYKLWYTCRISTVVKVSHLGRSNLILVFHFGFCLPYLEMNFSLSYNISGIFFLQWYGRCTQSAVNCIRVQLSRQIIADSKLDFYGCSIL